MRKVVMCIIVMLLSVHNYAQEGKFLPDVIPPSPEAAALSKFTDIPISHYTGLPNVSIPIHTISQKGIQIPISLSYHARGVKVSEIAPRTGMGWSLTYGGSISRQVRGKADDSGFPNAYLKNKNDFINYPKSRQTRNAVDSKEVQDPGYDFYPDQFNFSAGNTSGKFILDYTDGKPVVQSFGDIEITYTRERDFQGPINAFEVKDSNGNIYYYGKSKDGSREALDFQSSQGFSVYNNNVRNGGSGGSERVYNSWKLMDIETSYGEVISFYYENEIVEYTNKAYDKHDTPLMGTTNSVVNMDNINAINTKLSRINSHEHQLKRIESDQGSIVFTKQTTAREDYNGHALDNISIYNQNNTLVKSFKLNYSYTESTDKSNLLWYFKQADFSKTFKRLFLTSIEEEGTNGSKLPPYTFNYNSTVLPSRFSTRQDYWGYYNGATNNGPFLRMFEYGNYKPDRRVNIEKSEAGLLEEITYPTGGKTRFTYEHNKGFAPSFVGKVKVPLINPGSNNEVTLKLTKKDFLDPTTKQYKPYKIDLPKNTIFNYRVNCFHFRHADGDPNIPDCLYFFLRGGAQLNVNQEYVEATNNSVGSSIQFSVGLLNFSDVDEQALHLLDIYDFEIIFSYQKGVNGGSLLYGGGKRIKRIEYITANNTVSTKDFEYKNLNGSSSSGSIIGLPGYINKGESELPNGTTIKTLTHYFDQTSAYSAFQPNSIGYSYVTEYNGTKDNNKGKTVYSFTNMEDNGGDYYEFPYHPSTDNEWLRGKNINTKVYKNIQNSNYELVKEISNQYLYANFNDAANTGWFRLVYSPPALEFNFNEDYTEDHYTKNKTMFKLPLFMRRRSPLGVNTWGYRTYYLVGGTQNLLSTTEKNYLEGNEISTITNYFYDYDKHYQLAGSEVINSKGEILKTENTYPAKGSRLHNEHRISMPIKVENFKNTTSISKQNTIYKDFDGIYLPEKVQTSKAGQDLEDRVVFHEYNDKGNPVEVSKKDGTKIYYVWGYDKTQPIAKIESYGTISSAKRTAINNAINASNLDTSEGTENTLRSQLSSLRTAFSEAQVTTFTYDPLIGVTSITDPRGETVYYEYDTFNRLLFIKNAEGHILKEHQYNYKN